MGTPARGAGASRSDRGLSREAERRWRERRILTRSATSRPTTARSWRSAASSLDGARAAASSPCWAPTAPARPPCSRPSPASSTRRRAASSSRAARSSACDPDQVVRLGISHVPEGREVFPFLSVRENLLMGAYTRRDPDGVAQRPRGGVRLLPGAAGARRRSAPARSRAASSRCWRSAAR